jgi:DNA-binding transcriptional LysR family regulator
MDTASLQTFVQVAECGSFSVAGERLYLTQPAISKRIAALETEVAATLFDRIGRKVRLTEAGRALLPRAKQILREVEDSRRAISNLTGTISGQLSIATSHHIGLHRLPPLLRAYTNQYPAVELDLRFMDSEAACRLIERGDLEFGIVTLPLQPIAGLATETIWPDPLTVVVGNAHPLASRRRTTLAQLCEHRAILPAPNTYTRQHIEERFAAESLQPPVGMSTNYLETIKMLVSVGLGWSVLPQSMLGDDLHVLSVPGIRLQRQLGAVWHRNRTLSNAAQAMLELLRAQHR